jgi:anaphase-promoting complex subunit 1
LALCVANIKAAAILSIGFKYAGTSDPKAKNLIIQTLNYFREEIRVVPSVQPLGQQQTIGGFGARNCLDKNTADSSLCICVLALSMVMAGSCDLESFRVIRVLRKRFETDMHFGYNQAVL